ncbi:MAG: hypothetical protein OH316_00005, partial [Candidatus Parvarchaeota archaeon]|nr:hypothetical protein [Candidatus Parvarchaeota archaeon]
MEVEISDVEMFKDVMASIGSLMPDISLDFLPDGLSIKAMDPPSIAMVIFDAKKEMFSLYDVDKDVRLSISLYDLNSILRFAKEGSKVQLKDMKGRLKIIIKDRNEIEFTIPLIDEDYTAQKIPQLKMTAEIVLLSSIIKNGVKMASTVDDSMYFMIDEDKFSMSAKNADKEFLESFSMNSNKEIFNIKSEGLTKSKYSVDYLQKM